MGMNSDEGYAKAIAAIDARSDETGRHLEALCNERASVHADTTMAMVLQAGINRATALMAELRFKRDETIRAHFYR